MVQRNLWPLVYDDPPYKIGVSDPCEIGLTKPTPVPEGTMHDPGDAVHPPGQFRYQYDAVRPAEQEIPHPMLDEQVPPEAPPPPQPPLADSASNPEQGSSFREAGGGEKNRKLIKMSTKIMPIPL
jgi:hypothetical protein